MPNGQALPAAADLLGRGFSIIPVEHQGKRPVIAWRKYQDARASEDEVFSWFDSTPRNVGIVTGAISGVVVVDCDSPEAIAWADQHLPATPMVTTTAKGQHRFYRHPGQTVRNTARIRTGDERLALDVRGDGGYVVAPGSIHESGARYERQGQWPAIDELPVFDPSWIEDERSAAPGPGPLVAGTIAAGQRNDQLYRLARGLVSRNLTAAAVRAAVEAENLQRCTPPLDAAELNALIDNALRQPDQPGFERTANAADPAAKWRILDDVQLLELPDPQFLIDGVLQERGVTVIYGPPGVGKTSAIASVMVSVATGRDWFGCKVTRPGHCLYVGAEDPSGFKVRLAAAKRAAGLPLNVPIGAHTFPDAIDLRDELNVQMFADFVRQHFGPDRPLSLLVVDTYSAATPGAVENSSEDTSTAMAHGHWLKDTLGCAVVYAHHTNASGTRERGHSSMRGSADTMLVLQPVDDVIHVEADKQRNGQSGIRLFSLKLVPEAGGSVVVRLAGDVLPSGTLSTHQRRAYDVLRETFGLDGAAKGEWQRVTTGVPERSFHRAAKMLTEAGYVRQVGTHFRITEKVPS